MSVLTFNSVPFEIVDRNNQPWLRGYQIGSALQYSQPDAAISKLYERNKDEFTDAMTGVVKLATAGGMQETRIFSLRGAHLLGMFARTGVAKEFRKWVLDVLDKEIQPQFLHTISAAQQQQIKAGVLALAKRNNIAYPGVYLRFYEAFQIPRYQDLPASRFDEAMEWLGVKTKVVTESKAVQLNPEIADFKQIIEFIKNPNIGMISNDEITECIVVLTNRLNKRANYFAQRLALA